MKQVLFVVSFTMLSVMTLAQQASSTLLGRIDHLVYATPDLQLGIDAIEKQLGRKGHSRRSASRTRHPQCARRTRPDQLSGDHRTRSRTAETIRPAALRHRRSQSTADCEVGGQEQRASCRRGQGRQVRRHAWARLRQAAAVDPMASCSPGATRIRRSSSRMAWCRSSSTGDHRRTLR